MVHKTDRQEGVQTMALNGAAITVLCFCAEWCRVCNAYRTTFATFTAHHQDIRFAYVDIEDEAALLDAFAAVNLADVVDFPTLLIADAAGLLFLGPVTPQSETLERLVRAAVTGDIPRRKPSVDAAALQPLLQGIAERGLYLETAV